MRVQIISSPNCPQLSRGKTLFGLIFVAVSAVLVSCGEPPLGSGIGLPSFAERGASAPLSLGLVRVYAPPPNSLATGYLELINRSQLALDLSHTPLYVQSHSGSARLAQGTLAAGAVLQVQGNDFAALSLHANAGELAVFDSNLVLADYAAWGNDPNLIHSAMGALASSLGLNTAWRPLPYPLDDGQAIALDSTRPHVACVGADPGLVAPQPALSCQSVATGGSLWLSRLVPHGLDGNGSAIELFNPGIAPLDAWGVLLCHSRSGCRPLFTEGTNTANSVLVGQQGGAEGSPEPSRRRVVLRDGRPLSPDDLISDLPPLHAGDEIVLAPPGGSPALPWSYALTTPYGATPADVTAMPWVDPALRQSWLDAKKFSPRLAGEALALLSGASNAPSAPSAWRLSARPMGTVLRDPATPYDACSAPQTPKSATVVIDEVMPWDTAGSAMVILKNITAAPVALAQTTLALGSTSISLLPSGAASKSSIAAGGRFWVLIGGSPCATAGASADVCADGITAPFSAGEFTLFDGSTHAIVSHVQFKSSTTTADINGQAAAAAGAWAAPTCRINAVLDAGTQRLARAGGTAGQSPADYTLAMALIQH